MAFQKGQSGNPKGRAVAGDKPATDALRMEVAADDHKVLRELAKILIARAKSGDMQAMNTIFDRLEGKALQQSENYNMNEHVFADLGPEMTDKQFSDMVDEIKRLDTAPVYRGNGKHHGNGSANGRGRTK